MTNGARKSAAGKQAATKASATQAGKAEAKPEAKTSAAVESAAKALAVAAAATTGTGPDEQATQNIEEQSQAEAAAMSNVTDTAFSENEAGLNVRASDNGIGMIEVRGTGLRYVGVAPQRKKPGTVSKRTGYVLTGENTIFTPLGAVPYEAGYAVEDPKTGEFYATPQSGNMSTDPSRWLDVRNPKTGEPLVGDADPEASKRRREKAGLAPEK